MKDDWNHYGAMDESYSEQQICATGHADIICH